MLACFRNVLWRCRKCFVHRHFLEKHNAEDLQDFAWFSVEV